MRTPSEVNNEEWLERVILFDNGEYSIISATYQGRRCLGLRWNGSLDDEDGFPIARTRRPDWFCIPEFLEVPTLYSLLDEVWRNPSRQVGTNGPNNIIAELRTRRRAKL